MAHTYMMVKYYTRSTDICRNSNSYEIDKNIDNLIQLIAKRNTDADTYIIVYPETVEVTWEKYSPNGMGYGKRTVKYAKGEIILNTKDWSY